jgi:hypothetical protein
MPLYHGRSVASPRLKPRSLLERAYRVAIVECPSCKHRHRITTDTHKVFCSCGTRIIVS